jgi:hypothetical protein
MTRKAGSISKDVGFPARLVTKHQHFDIALQHERTSAHEHEQEEPT